MQQRGSLLYSVGELDESEISAFRISEDKTQVTLINKLPLGNHTGYGTQLTLWPDNRHISSANYRGGSLEGSTIYVSLFPCNECAKAIIQAGIKRIVYDSDKYDGTPSVVASKRMLKAAGVVMQKYEHTNREITIRL